VEKTQNARGYKVVVNHNKQYSIWPVDGKIPLGWKDIGILGSRGDCFAFIEKVWIDARPPNLRTNFWSAINRL